MTPDNVKKVMHIAVYASYNLRKDDVLKLIDVAIDAISEMGEYHADQKEKQRTNGKRT